MRRKYDDYTVGWRPSHDTGSINMVVRHPEHRHTFCGYYDRSPWSPDGGFLLVCCVDADSLSDPLEPAHIYTYDLAAREFTHIASTRCWNFQQAAQQQWCGPGKVLLNTENGGKPAAKIYVIGPEPSPVGEIPASAGMVSRRSGLVALYDYRPLSVFEHDYGYRALSGSADYEKTRDHLQIVIWSLNDMTPVLTLGPEELDDIDRDDTMSREGIRYVQHVKFNRSGGKVFFVLRSALASRKVPYSSLYAYNLETGRLTVLISTAEWCKGCNHPVWANDDDVLVNLFDDSYKARKFIMIDASDACRRIIAAGYDGVGHPTICDDGKFILTDEYLANKMQILTRYPLPFGRRMVLGRFPPAKYPKGPDRCDLHPRYDTGSRMSAVDHYDGDGRVVSLVGPLG